MAEKTKGLARASCSTEEHIRAIDGSVLVEEASPLHAGPCQAEMAEIEVAQNALCFAAPPGLAKSSQRIHGHRRSSKQILEEPRNQGLICGEISLTIFRSSTTRTATIQGQTRNGLIAVAFLAGLQC